MNDYLHEELFVERKSPISLKLVAAVAALLITVLVFVGYTYIRQRHAENNPSLASSTLTPAPVKPPQALIIVDDALLQSGKSLVGGTVRNTSSGTLGQLSVELELRRRKDATAEKKLIQLQPSQLEPGQEGRYSLELKPQEYASARLVGLRAGPESSPIPYATAQGQKRPPERIESRTITVDRRSTKRDEFLNSPDKPARVP